MIVIKIFSVHAITVPTASITVLISFNVLIVYIFPALFFSCSVSRVRNGTFCIAAEAIWERQGYAEKKWDSSYVFFMSDGYRRRDALHPVKTLALCMVMAIFAASKGTGRRRKTGFFFPRRQEGDYITWGLKISPRVGISVFRLNSCVIEKIRGNLRLWAERITMNDAAWECLHLKDSLALEIFTKISGKAPYLQMGDESVH